MFFFCKSPDSLEHTFLACSVAEDFYYEMMAWFNNEQKSQIIMTKQQILFNDFSSPRRIRTATEVEVWNFHNTNEKVYLRLLNDGKIPTCQSIETKT